MTAEPSPVPPLAGPGEPHNAFTVDLEDWFHVCGVEIWGATAMVLAEFLALIGWTGPSGTQKLRVKT